MMKSAASTVAADIAKLDPKIGSNRYFVSNSLVFDFFGRACTSQALLNPSLARISKARKRRTSEDGHAQWEGADAASR